MKRRNTSGEHMQKFFRYASLAFPAILLMSACSKQQAPDTVGLAPPDASSADYQPSMPAATPVNLAACSVKVDHDCGIEQQIEIVPPAILHWPKRVDCSLKILVLEDGSALAISTRCSDGRFEASVRDAAASIRYKTHDGCGNVCRTIGREFDYPVIFQLQDE